ncbi:MAG: chromosomal replication initiation protein DnaA [Deltaproteobacteria bacterium RIFCSPLOWO2_02_FULL_44_10]|nr:MAG: chromosomal replication initiation protein DnaA [Deltaproteobacteria bacterium RIFCSPHIGHO2_02_FULL_44_16]OGQ45439.1 MAG: chromosomal replication initiation protein DnaA [Deltaproteobacteria bacterium RIFCSPLOWO2_02_FULL_44_10]
MPDLLQQLKERVFHKISRLNFSTWFEPIEAAKREGENFTLVVPNKFVADWIQDYYHDLIKQELKALTNLDHRIQFEVREETEHANETSVSGNVEKVLPERIRNISHLNPKYTFDRFVVGSSNQFAHAASKATAELPGGNYNPLFLYGGVGLGKTHLLHAIGLDILRQRPELSIVYVSSERFMNELINAIRYEKTAEFRRKYRDMCDVLLIDDIQFIAGKERTQDEFFHTFNTLHEAQKQLVMTSDKSPKDIQGLEERLRSRFEWGLIADIQAPDLETRIAILKKKADAEKLGCPDDVAMFLASSIKSNVRELEGSLLRLNAFASLTKSPLSVDFAREVLKNVIDDRRQPCSIEAIQRTVATFYQVNVSDLKSPRRVRSFSYPRQIAMYLCKKHAGASFPEIGQRFGGKDHTTVIHACRKIEKLLQADIKLKNDIESLEKNLTH